MATNKLYIVEPTKNGFKGTASGASRAAIVGPTQGAVAQALHDRFPNASVVAARVRNTSVNTPDKSGKSKVWLMAWAAACVCRVATPANINKPDLQNLEVD